MRQLEVKAFGMLNDKYKKLRVSDSSILIK